MSEKAKQSVWWAIERLGLPTVFCVLVWFGLRGDVAAYRSELVDTMRGMQLVQSEQKAAMASYAAQAVSQTALNGQISTKLEQLAERVRDNDRRITRREDNQFTAQDGMDLQSDVVRNSTLIAEQSKDVATIRDDIKEMQAAMNKIYHAVQRRNQ